MLRWFLRALRALWPLPVPPTVAPTVAVRYIETLPARERFLVEPPTLWSGVHTIADPLNQDRFIEIRRKLANRSDADALASDWVVVERHIADALRRSGMPDLTEAAPDGTERPVHSPRAPRSNRPAQL